MLYSTPMVQGILEDRKNQTRRTKGLELINKTPDEFNFIGIGSNPFKKKDKSDYYFFKREEENGDTFTNLVPVTYKIGDIIWVRENLKQCGELGLEYSADGEIIDEDIIPVDYGPYGGKYTFRTIPSIHMPKWACRIFLKVVSIKVQRLRDIFHSDARSEGIDFTEGINGNLYYNYLTLDYGCNELYSFMTLWQSINGVESWEFNPWVWVIEFERIEKPLDFIV